MGRCKQSVNVIKRSHLSTITPPLPRPPSTLCPLSLLLSAPLYHSFKIVVALEPLANESMSLFRAGQGPASQLPPGCSLIDSPPQGEWQAALLRPWWARVTAAGVSLCRGPVGGCRGPQDPSTRGRALSSLLGSAPQLQVPPQQEQSRSMKAARPVPSGRTIWIIS